MDPLTLVLLALLVSVGAYFWIREQRTWRRVHGAPGNRPETAVRLHYEFRRAGIRSRYRLAGTGASMFQGHSGANQTALVLVHRDDLHRAEQVRASMRSESRATS